MSHDNDEFRPVFIVGNPRSGTTLTAVLLDRHSRIAVPPETNYFNLFLPSISKHDESNREALVHLALQSERLCDLGLDVEKVLEHFKRYPLTVYDLFRVILEEYTKERGKVRPGEKTPMHIRHVDEIIKLYPNAKVICVVRDGRDVVGSMLNTWGDTGRPRRTEWSCMVWVNNARLAVKYSKKYPEMFTIIKFESLLQNPESELRKVLEFIGEEYESSLLDGGNCNSGAIPAWENEWKGKSNQQLDPSRIEAWRRNNDIKQICVMNAMMGKMLRKFGYYDTSLSVCPWIMRIRLVAVKIAFLPVLRPIARLSVRCIGLINSVFRKR